MIKDDQVMRCDKCEGAVKPDITFFGEGLPDDFFESCKVIQENEPDLLIVCGTALAVSPFKNIVGMISNDVPKVLFNMEDVFETSGYQFDKPKHNKILVKGKCDENIRKLVKDVNWVDDFEKVLPECHKNKF